jgi:23S rRNA (cytidine1920-2'-O)/16S rRNA (cytidine1409-2'-O)-methyltransferase
LPKEKIRLDTLLLELSITNDIKRAQSLILSGSVFVDEKKITKTGIKFHRDVNIRIKNVIPEYASRGANKILPVLEKFKIDLKGKKCIDLGASTGGFTDVLISKDVESVIAIDVGYGQMIERLRNHPKVHVVDRFNAKDLNWDIIKKEKINIFIVIDLSFISLLSIYPAIHRLKKEEMDANIEVLSLIKPQFECNPVFLEKGILKNSNERFSVIKKILKYIRKMKSEPLGLTISPIRGTEGNVEYFIYWKV